MRQKRLGDAHALRLGARIANPAAKLELFYPRHLGRQRDDRQRIGNDDIISFTHPIPFEHGEFRMVQRRALAIAPDMLKARDPPLAGCQQLFHGEFGRGVEIHRLPFPIVADHRGAKGM